jgi:hypothetical protein
MGDALMLAENKKRTQDRLRACLRTSVSFTAPIKCVLF